MRIWLVAMVSILVACGAKPSAAPAPAAADGAGDAALADATPAADAADGGGPADTAKPDDVADVAPVADVPDAAATDVPPDTAQPDVSDASILTCGSGLACSVGQSCSVQINCQGPCTQTVSCDCTGGKWSCPEDCYPECLPDADAGSAPDAEDAATDGDASTGPLVQGNLVAAGWSFGECLGACKGVLELQGASLLLTTSGWDGTVYYQAKGVLTTGAAAKLQDIEAALAGKPLATTFGCPDCADGGAFFVTFGEGATPTTHTYEFAKPPAVLGELDQLLSAAIAGLKTCKGDATVVVQNPCPLDLP